ncbi:MAG: DUF4381 domain-containing protein [Thermomonas sp.]
MSAPLALRDVHAGMAPSLWPPAPGWWMLSAALLVVVSALAWWRWRKRRRHAEILRMFDAAIDRAATPSQQIAAMSELLRRAARRQNPAADRMQGDVWLGFLDEGMPKPVFLSGAGALLLEGGFRADVSTEQATALRALARERYLRWMQPK